MSPASHQLCRPSFPCVLGGKTPGCHDQVWRDANETKEECQASPPVTGVWETRGQDEREWHGGRKWKWEKLSKCGGRWAWTDRAPPSALSLSVPWATASGSLQRQQGPWMTIQNILEWTLSSSPPVVTTVPATAVGSDPVTTWNRK